MPAASDSSLRGWRGPVIWLAVILPPLIVYSRTMAPGLIARGDSPKFQFLGSVLGTAHQPGYPLFICLSWMSTHLPAGTPAWRINLMTMLFGAGAAAFTSWAARGFGAPPVSSVAAGLGLAFGSVFWAQATRAEVYTLAALLLSLTLGLVARWQSTRRPGYLLGAVGAAALAAGHHPMIAFAAPALVAFVVMTDWRVLTRPLLLAACALMIALGLAQYLFIVIRTAQHAPFLEATALDVREIVDLWRGTQYQTQMLAFSWSDLLHTRLPLVWRIVAHELSLAGLLFAALGVIVLARRNLAAMVLLTLTGAGAFAFACTFNVPDVEVFVIPTFLALWLLVAVGLGVVERLPVWRPMMGRLAAAAITAGLSTVLVSRAYAQEDLSRETYDVNYFDAFFQRVHFPGSFLLDEDHEYENHQALRYKLYAENAARGPFHAGDLDEVNDPQSLLKTGRDVYAFEPARAFLEGRGLLFAPVTLSTLDMSRRPLFRAIGTAPCRDVSSGEWAIFNANDLLGPRLSMWIRAGGRGPGLDTARVTVYGQTDDPPADHATRLVGGARLDGREENFHRDVPAERQALIARLAQDGLTMPASQPFVGRDQFTLPLTGPRTGMAVHALSPRPTWLAVRFEAEGGTAGRFCASPTHGMVAFGDPSQRELELIGPHGDYVDSGWSDVDEAAGRRWTTAPRSRVQFTLADPIALKTVIVVKPASEVGDAPAALIVNGGSLETYLLQPGETRYEWIVPASALHRGHNEMVLAGPAPHDSRALGVRSFLLTRVPQP